jgi:hypothetical protein
MVHPPALTTKSGDLLASQRGRPLSDLRTKKTIVERVSVGDFFEKAQSSPIAATLVVYDAKGGVVWNRRYDVQIRRVVGGGRL